VVAKVLLDATSFEEAASSILEAVCQSMHWPYGTAWIVDRERVSASAVVAVQVQAATTGASAFTDARPPGGAERYPELVLDGLVASDRML
jgi:hypothetical protein